VYEARDWAHGTFIGATLGSETTAAATGTVGIVRRDPMAMLPFCGYDMAAYFGHWLDVGAGLKRPPRIFGVNWFRTAGDGRYLWPGFGDNLRVLQWILDRCEGRGAARETPIGHVPAAGGIDVNGLGVSDADMRELLRVDPAEWAREADAQRVFFEMFEDRLPAALRQQHARLQERLKVSVNA
jgi:phosphoenolpyruvate carboxykinase (GTP)